MRNLKRVLSLALALVMVLGMMVITTSAADYTDAEEIKYEEAVEVMSALGILNGNPDGSFNPKGTLTREQAAKILAFVTMGAEADEYLTGSAAPFDDVAATKWSAKYIAYCKNLGIIDGVGNNLFNPAGTLTVVQFAKMLLVAADIDGEYTGSNWANNVKNAVAKTEMKNTGIKITTAEITREEACALALAAMKSGGSTTRYFDVVVDDAVEATFDNITDAYVMKSIVGGDVVPRVETSGTLLADTHKVNYISDDADAYGNPGVGYEKTDAQGKKVIDLFYGEEAALTYTTNKNTVAGKKAIAADLKALGVTVDADDEDRFSNTSVAIVDGGNTVNVRKVGSLAGQTGENAVVKVYVEDKAVTLITVVNTYADYVETVTEAEGETPAYVTLAGGKTFNTEAFAENDVVLYTLSGADVETLVKAEAVTGTLTGYTKAGKFTIGEKVYEISGITGVLTNADAVAETMGEEMVYSLDANGKIVAVAEPEGAVVVAPVITDYAVVLDSNAKVETKAAEWPATGSTTTITAQIQVLLADGTVEIWDVAVAKADKDIKVNGETKVSQNEYYFAYGKQYVVVAITEAEGTEAAAANKTAVEEALIENATGVWTYADKALVAPVATELTEATVEKTTVLSGEIDAIDATSYVVDDVILNDKTVFILKDTNEQTGKESIVVKTGLAALESTSSFTGLIVATYTPAFDENKELDAENCTTVATLVFAQDVEFDATIEPAEGTDDLVFVDENYAVSVVGQDTFHTYSVVYADGSADTIAVKVTDDYSELDTGVYYLMDDGSIDVETGILVSATLKVKIISGTTVILVDGEENLSAMTTNAKTVVVGGELEVGAEAYVVAGDNNTIALAFIVE